MTANRSQDLKEDLRAESTWKEAPKSVRDGRSAVCIFLYHCTLRGPPGSLPGRGGRGSCSPVPRASWGSPTPSPRARTPPRPRAGPAPASSRPLPPRPLPPPGRPASQPKLWARPGSARSCSSGRMPSVSVSCYGNPDRGEFRIRNETEPRAPPDPPLASRAFRPQTEADWRCFSCGPSTQLRKCQGCR